MGRDNSNPLGVTLSIKFDPEQFDTLNHKLDKILAALGQKADLETLATKASEVSSRAKTEADSLQDLSKQNQP